MGNIRKFLKYFLPLIVLPMLSGYLSSMYAMATNALGVSAVAARGTISSMNSIYTSVLHLMAIALLAVVALLAEKGKTKAAKTVHLVGLLVYVTTLILIAAAYLFMPQFWMRFMGVPAEVFSLGISYARTFILPALLVSVIVALISQFSGKHSFILAIALGAGVISLAGFIGVASVRIFSLGLSGISVTDGLSFAVSSVMPFLMVPVKSYSDALAPKVSLGK